VEGSARRLVAGTKVELRCDFEGLKQELAPYVEQNILRIAQEALANAVKHAQPSLIEVQLKRENGSVYLRVKDDGRGFGSPGTPSIEEGHFGIMGMRERAERSGGQFSLTSVLGSGTLVEVKIPVCAQKARA
jgi:signal transduction histidine kinase